MSAYINTSYEDRGRSIDEFIADEIEPLRERDIPILNMCLTNGVMGRKDQLKLRQIYPNLFDEVQNFLNQKKRGSVFIYKEEGKPTIVNVFVNDTAKGIDGVYSLRKSMSKSIRTYCNKGKLPRTFVFIADETHKKMVERVMKWQFGYRYTFVSLKLGNIS